jgi:hypothetical protein
MKRALERTQPLLIIPASASKKTPAPIISIDNQDVLITTLIPGEDKKHFLIRMYNPGSEDQEVEIIWNVSSSLAVKFSSCGLSGEEPVPFNGKLVMKAGDFQTVRVDF